MFKLKLFLNLLIFQLIFININAFPEQGKWDVVLDMDRKSFTVPKSLYAGSSIYLQIICDTTNSETVNVKVSWSLWESKCWEDYVSYMYTFEYEGTLSKINRSHQISSPAYNRQCSHGGHIMLPELKVTNEVDKIDKPIITKRDKQNTNDPVFTIGKDGVYLFTLDIGSEPPYKNYNASVHLEIRSDYGYLAAADWPLLPFYGAMCLVYVLLGIIWLVVSFLQWRDLLRIQFWIGGVILLGMLEKAMFYGEYQSLNTNGISIRGVVLIAEWTSCAKRTLARMLVIIVSLGFGIIKPRLGPMLHRVVGTGALYFVLACIESYLRIMHTKNDPSNQILLASIPLAVLDSAICWWIFTSLVQTTRTLRLRRNMVKLSLYRHFTNTLIFAVLASVIFMLYSIKIHRFAECLTDWKELWVDEAFWHVLFSTLLLVIMILWRPTNNNQRYAFTPLLDNPEDEDDEEEQFVSDAYGVKMRGPRSNSPKPNAKSATNDEDDLKWVEENIPAAIAEAALPVLDSDEEIINTKFEVSKMQ
uniref:Putative conserved plasma membrane protein n=1 Tax=Corethrella appendiculata TaxID=1370023 RepID=U5EXR0_9DIPT